MSVTDRFEGYDVDGKKNCSATEALRYVAKGGEINEEYHERLRNWCRGLGPYRRGLFKDEEIQVIREFLKMD